MISRARSIAIASARQFTLVELMIVLAIIAVLAALLMPGLRSAHAMALTAACTSNLRQCGIAVTAYAGDNNGWLLSADGFTSGGARVHRARYWSGQLALYGYVPEQLTNPYYGTMPGGSPFLWNAALPTNTVFACPALPPQKHTYGNATFATSSFSTLTTYGLQSGNYYGCSGNAKRKFWVYDDGRIPGSNNDYTQQNGGTTTRINWWATSIGYLTDSVITAAGSSGYNLSQSPLQNKGWMAGAWSNDQPLIHRRHQDAANTWFLDGRVGTMTVANKWAPSIDLTCTSRF